MKRSLGFGLVLLGWAALASGEEVGRTPGRQTLYDMRRLGTALMYWQLARMEAWSPEERAAMEEKEKLTLQARNEAAKARGEYVDPKTMTPTQMFESMRPMPKGLGETKRLAPEQLQALLQPAGSKAFLDSIPTVDGWGRPFEVWIDLNNLLNLTVFAVRSAGANGRFQEPPYTPGAFESGNELDDVVYIDGWFYRWPVGDAGPLKANKLDLLSGLEEDDGL